MIDIPVSGDKHFWESDHVDLLSFRRPGKSIPSRRTLVSRGRSARQLNDAAKVLGRGGASQWARGMMADPSFVVTDGVRYELAILFSRHLRPGYLNERIVRAAAKRRGYRTPPVEVAALWAAQAPLGERPQFVVIMHKAIGFPGGMGLLGTEQDLGREWLKVWFADSLPRNAAFVFLAPRRKRRKRG